MRTAIAPGVWRDDGPCSAVSHGGTVRDIRPVHVVGAMLPILKGELVRSPGDLRRQERRLALREASARYRAKHR